MTLKLSSERMKKLQDIRRNRTSMAKEITSNCQFFPSEFSWISMTVKLLRGSNQMIRGRGGKSRDIKFRAGYFKANLQQIDYYSTFQ